MRTMNPCLVAMLACLFAGCSAVVRTPYQRPAVVVPADWDAAGATASTAPDAQPGGRWWSRFDDDALDRAIERALARNNDLAAAAIRVRRAQLQADVAATALVPSLDAGVNARTSRDLDDGGPGTRSHSASLGVSYELDLWGRLGSQRDAARWEARATAEDLASARLVLIATTTGLYWQLGYLNERIAASEASIAYAQRTLALVRTQFEAGAVSRLELSDAEQNLVSQKAAHESLLQQRGETRNAWAILFDAPPDDASPDEPEHLDTREPPVLAAGLPADLLARRPDLRAAELRLRATLAGVDATRASWYPSISLTAGASSGGISLGDVLKNPVGTLGAGLSLPFLNLHQRGLDIAVAETQYEEAVVGFRQALYQALADTANALAARETLASRAAYLARSLDAARTAERLYEVRYRAGAVALRSWLDAQERRRAAETAAAEVQLARLNAQVTVFQALGGDAVVP